MSQWRKKPVVIEAFCWTGGPDHTEDPDWIIEAIKEQKVGFLSAGTPECRMIIATLEGNMIAEQGDWIIRGVKGEIYPCKPDIFEATYESVDVMPEAEARELDEAIDDALGLTLIKFRLPNALLHHVDRRANEEGLVRVAMLRKLILHGLIVPPTEFKDAEALALWLESLYATLEDGAVTEQKWDVAQRAADAIRIAPTPPEAPGEYGDWEKRVWRRGYHRGYLAAKESP